MPLDSELIKSYSQPDDLASVVCDLLGDIPFKFLGLMLLFFVFFSSDVFINRILSKVNGAVDYKYPTSWGVIIQGLLLVLVMLVVDILMKQAII